MGIKEIVEASLPVIKAVSPLISVGTSIYEGVKQNKATEEYNEMMKDYYDKELAYKEKQDKQAQSNIARTMRLNDRTARWQMKQGELENQRIAEQTNYDRLQGAANKFAEYLNEKTSTAANRMVGFQRR